MASRRLRVAACAALAAVWIVAPVSASAGGPFLSADDAVLREPVDSVVRVLEPFQGCQVLLDSGEGDCAVVDTANGQLVFIVEAGERFDNVLVSRPWIVRIYRPVGDDQWEVALATRPQGNDPGPVYADVKAEVGDVTGDGEPELLVGYRSEGTGQILDVDIVGTADNGAPVVLAAMQLYKGTAKIKHGTLVTWTPVYRRADANCCPTWIRRDVVRFVDGGFAVDPGPKVPTKQANIPPGDF